MSRRYEYKLVEFVDERGDQKSIDIVPTDWIQFDKERSELVAPFIPHASKANLKILNNRVRQRHSPLKSWPVFVVAVKGYADTYEEAEKKIKSLETASYAFSTDNEDRGLMKELQQKKTYIKGPHNRPLRLPSSVDLRKPLRNPRDDQLSKSKPVFERNGGRVRQNERFRYASDSDGVSDGDSAADNSHSTVERTASPNTRHKTIRKPKTVLRQLVFESDSEDIPSDVSGQSQIHADRSARKTDRMRKQRCSVSDKTPTSSVAGNRQPSFIAKDLIQVETDDPNNNVDTIINKDRPARKTDRTSQKRCSVSDKMPVSSVAGNPQPSFIAKDSIQVETDDLNSNIDTNEIILICYRKLSAQIARVSGLVVEMKIHLDEKAMTGHFDKNKPSQSDELQAFIEERGCKHLPFQTLADFEAFDVKLKEDKNLHDEVMTIMWTIINNKDPVLKPVKDIMKNFMSRNVVRSYTAKKATGDKKASSATNFGECMRDAILNEYKKRTSGSPVKVDSIYRAIGSVINNAKDWDGMRSVRKPIPE